MNDIKFLYGLVSGIIDSPFRSLSRLGFRIPGITRSRDPYYLASMTRNYLDDDPLRKDMSFIKVNQVIMTFSFRFLMYIFFFFFSYH